MLKVYYRSVFAESFKTFIFQKFRRPLCHKVNLPSCVARRPLCHKVNLPRCEARRRHFIMTCDIFGTGQTNTLGIWYLFGLNDIPWNRLVIQRATSIRIARKVALCQTYKQPTGAPLNTLDKITALVETNHTISLAFKTLS